MSKLKELKEQRMAAAKTLEEKLNAEQNTETRSKVDEVLASIETIDGDIKRIERADAIAAELRSGAQGNAAGGNQAEPDPKMKAEAYRAAWKEYMTRGTSDQPRAAVLGGCGEERLNLLNATRRDMGRAQTREQRDQLAGSQSITYTEGAVGGYFVPAGFVYNVEKATKFYANLLDGSTVRVMETATGQVLPYPTSNDTNQAWTLVGEASQVTDQGASANYPTTGTLPSGQPGDLGMGHVNFNAYKGTTGLIRVSLELMQDSAFDLEQFLTEAFAVRLGRGYEYYLTNGSGTNAPTGILPAIAASGATPITAQGSTTTDGIVANTGANSIGYEDLTNLQHGVDPTYRRNGKYMFADTTLRHLRTRLDKFGRPLWVPGVKDGEPDTICGFPYVINQSFPSIAASATTIAFGDFSKFIVRKVRDLQVLRLTERFADYGEVAFVAFSRLDSNLVDGGTHPLNTLVQHS